MNEERFFKDYLNKISIWTKVKVRIQMFFEMTLYKINNSN